MQETYNSLIKKFKNKKIMFCGLGRSNVPFMNMLTNEQINIIAYDSKKKENLDKELIKQINLNPYIELRAGDEEVWNEKIDIIIRTPGMNFLSEKLTRIREKGTTVTSEMEIFFDLCPCPIIGITGSDGKTTVSTLIYNMLKKQGLTVYLGGNIGTPILPKIRSIVQNDVVVAELSSFQLCSMRKSPEIAIITNISPNHLDVHKNMLEYIDAKKHIFLHQNAFSETILNFDNLETRNMAKLTRGKTIFFSRKEKLNYGVWIDNDNNIIFSKHGENEKIINTSEIKIPGNHNIENYLASIAAVKNFVGTSSIKEVASSFGGVEHRIEFVKTINGVSYYNDSIASTPNRTISGALSLFDKKVILIAGGYDKKISFDSFAKEVLEKVSVLILIGSTADKIKNEVIQLKEYDKNNLPIIKAESLQQALNESLIYSHPNDIVILSPACASFDLYKDFEHRGNHFKKLVEEIK